jgi:hypothetical protein
LKTYPFQDFLNGVIRSEEKSPQEVFAKEIVEFMENRKNSEKEEILQDSDEAQEVLRIEIEKMTLEEPTEQVHGDLFLKR